MLLLPHEIGRRERDRGHRLLRPSTAPNGHRGPVSEQRDHGDDRDDPDLGLGLEPDADHHARGQQRQPVTGERADDEPT